MEKTQQAITLRNSGVMFDKDTHTYTLDGVLLQGITGLIKRQLFPDKYAGIPDEVLAQAAERGSAIHEDCETADNLYIEPITNEGKAYVRLRNDEGWQTEASEYLVSDNCNYASMIDKVYRVSADEFRLADIKTTQTLDIDYVRWQLSIYAYLFEQQNEGTKVTEIGAIWLRGNKAEYRKTDIIPAEAVKELLQADAEGRQYENKIEPICNLPERYAQAEEQILEWLQQADEITEKIKALKEGLLEEMKAADVYSWKSDRLRITRSHDSERTSLNTSALQKEMPEVYVKYLRTTAVKGGVTIKAL